MPQSQSLILNYKIRFILRLLKKTHFTTIIVFALSIFLYPRGEKKFLPPPKNYSVLAKVETGFHAHNDFSHSKPLLNALSHSFSSIEADVWWQNNKLMVSHFGFFSKGTLEELYLEPLSKRIHQQNYHLFLWIDLKSGNIETIKALHKVLKKYPFITQFSANETIQKKVTVVLTGQAHLKKIYGQKFSNRYAISDYHEFDFQSPANDSFTKWLSINFTTVSSWDGLKQISIEDYEQIYRLVRHVHQRGEKIRFWNAPDTYLSWQLQHSVGVDLIGTDQLNAPKYFRQLSPIDRIPAQQTTALKGQSINEN